MQWVFLEDRQAITLSFTQICKWLLGALSFASWERKAHPSRYTEAPRSLDS